METTPASAVDANEPVPDAEPVPAAEPAPPTHSPSSSNGSETDAAALDGDASEKIPTYNEDVMTHIAWVKHACTDAPSQTKVPTAKARMLGASLYLLKNGGYQTDSDDGTFMLCPLILPSTVT